MRAWIIEPRDTLVVKDGRPFGDAAGTAGSLDFPFPSTLAGAVRTRAGSDPSGYFAVPSDESERREKLDGLKRIESRGPILAELDDDGSIREHYVPAPADCLLLRSRDVVESTVRRIRLSPCLGNGGSGDRTNLPEGRRLISSISEARKGKPCQEIKYWRWDKAVDWLSSEVSEDEVLLESLGIGHLDKDTRVHVSVNDALASEEGALFQMRGLSFNSGESLSRSRRFALTVFTEDGNANLLSERPRIAPLAGERRLVYWREVGDLLPITKCPADLKKRIGEDRTCRIQLLTPGYFSSGLPTSTEAYSVVGVACNRYETVAGWDFETNRPKPSRRLLPAGSVIFVRLNAIDAEQWVEDTWFSCIGDDEQARRDGFGLCVLGNWRKGGLDHI